MADSYDYTDILSDVEGEIYAHGEPDLERDLSVNEWVNRIRAATISAHGAARTGLTVEEERAWLDIAGIAARRVRAIRENAARGGPAQG